MSMPSIGAVPSNASRGGTQRATVGGTSYNNLFTWLAAQKRQPR